MNRVFVITKRTQEEMYFAHETKTDEAVTKALEEFQSTGWKLKTMFSLTEENFYKLKMNYFYSKHMEYLNNYKKDPSGQEKTMSTENAVIKTAKSLIHLANVIIESDFDIEIPELVHSYLCYQLYSKEEDFIASLLQLMQDLT